MITADKFVSGFGVSVRAGLLPRPESFLLLVGCVKLCC